MAAEPATTEPAATNDAPDAKQMAAAADKQQADAAIEARQAELEQAKQPEPKPAEFPDTLKKRAEAAGISDLGQFNTPEQADLFLSRLDGRVAEALLKRQPSNAPAPLTASPVLESAKTPPAAPAQSNPTAPGQPSQPQAPFELNLPEIDGETMPELGKLSSGVRDLHQHYAAQLQQQNQALQLMAHVLREFGVQEQLRNLDNAANALPDEYRKFLPATSVQRVVPQSDDHNAWVDLHRMAQAIQGSTDAPDMSEALRRVLLMRHGDEIMEKQLGKAKEKLEEQVRDRNGQFTARPKGSQRLESDDPREESLKAARAVFDRAGVPYRK